MKSSILEQLGLGLALVSLPLVSGCLDEGGVSLESTAAAAPNNFETNQLQATQSPTAATPEEATPDLDVSTAPVKAVSREKPLPPNLHLTSSLSELLRLAHSGIEETVMLAYVTNATGAFSLGSEEIIYLNDVGVPVPVIIAMLQHDHLLLSEAANAALAALPAQPEPAAASPPPPAPETVEPAPAPEPEPITELALGAPPAESADAGFYDALAPYGNWVDVGGYGLCWQPSVAVFNPGWRPYCDRGHWVYTDCGWYWMSDYSWGWAPFHYGRWFCHASRGWCWAPDRVWGPSWVCWRYSNDYCGWAPLPPAACFRPGLGFFYGGLSVGFSFNVGIAASRYTYVPAKNFCDYRVSRFTVPHDRAAALHNQTVAVNKIVGDQNRIMNQGIPADRIVAATRRPIRPATVRDANIAAVQGVRGERLEPGGRTLTVFRPHQPPAARTPGSPAGVVRTDSGSTRDSTAEPLVIRGPSGTAQTGTSPIHASRDSNLAAGRAPRPEPWAAAAPTVASAPLNASKPTELQAAPRTYSPAVVNRPPVVSRNETPRNSSTGVRALDSRPERTAPLIIRGSSHSPQKAATPSFANREASPAAGRAPRAETAATVPRTQPQAASQRAPVRLVEVQPPFERATANEALQVRAQRYELQSRRSALPAAPAPQPIHQQPAAPAYQPPVHVQHSSPAPSFAPPPSPPAREIPAVRQPAGEVRAALGTPAPAPNAPAHGNAAQGNTSSEKRGR